MLLLLQIKVVCYTLMYIKDISVGIITAGRPRSQGSISGGGKRFSLIHSVQVGCGAHPLSCTMGKKGSLEVKPLERETDHSPSSAEGQDSWSYTSTPLYVFDDVVLS
jgi:hypothetical protein